MNTILKIENIHKYYGGVKAIKNVSCSIKKNDIFGIIGPNGAGKTTLFNVITGFDKPTSGRTIYKNTDMTNKPIYKMCEVGITRTFQNIRLFGKMTVIDNLVVGMHTTLRTNLLGTILNLKSFLYKEKQSYSDAHKILKYLNIDKFAFNISDDLPYGTQRKIEIGRALASQPELILLDEPSAGMNAGEVTELMELISGIRETGKTIVIIEHNMKVIMGICDRIMALNFGGKIAEGSPKEIQDNELVIESYLGKEE